MRLMGKTRYRHPAHQKCSLFPFPADQNCLIWILPLRKCGDLHTSPYKTKGFFRQAHSCCLCDWSPFESRSETNIPKLLFDSVSIWDAWDKTFFSPTKATNITPNSKSLNGHHDSEEAVWQTLACWARKRVSYSQDAPTTCTRCENWGPDVSFIPSPGKKKKRHNVNFPFLLYPY